MIIERNNNGGYTAFQRIAGGARKMGVVCEGPTRLDAIIGASELVIYAKTSQGMAAFFTQTENRKGVQQ